MIASTQITNTGILALVTVVGFELGDAYTQLATRNVNLTFLGGWVFACDVSLCH